MNTRQKYEVVNCSNLLQWGELRDYWTCLVMFPLMLRVLKPFYSMAPSTRLQWGLPSSPSLRKVRQSRCWEESLFCWREKCSDVRLTDSKTRELFCFRVSLFCCHWFRVGLVRHGCGNSQTVQKFTVKHMFWSYVLLTLNIPVLILRGNSQTTVLWTLPEKFSVYLSTLLFIPCQYIFFNTNGSVECCTFYCILEAIPDRYTKIKLILCRSYLGFH